MWRYLIMKWRFRDLIRRWGQYRQLVTQAMESGQEDPALDKRFLGLKAGIIARVHILTEVAPPQLAEEAGLCASRITDLLKKHTRARFRGPGEPWERDEFEHVWHEHYIFLNQLQGVIARPEETDKEKKAKRKSRGRRPVAADPIPFGASRFWAFRHATGLWFRRFRWLVLRLAFLALLVYVVAMAWGVHRGPDGQLTANAPTSFGGALENVLNSFEGVWDQGVNFFSPVVSAYGVLWTFVLLAVLAFSATYWLLLRP